LLALGEDVAGKIFALMDDDEIKDISQAMVSLGSVSASAIERLVVEFTEQFSATGALSGNFDSTERLLAKVLDKGRAAGIMNEIRGPAGRTVWAKLSGVREDMFAQFLKNEYPQTVAVILNKISTNSAARVLTEFPEAFAMEVIVRMLRIEAVNREVIEDLERIIRDEFMSSISGASRRDNHEMIAEIFNSLPKEVEARFSTALSERNSESATRVRDLMFRFEDLGRLDPAGIQTLLRSADKGRLALALKGASTTLREMFFANMSERASKMMRDDIDAMGGVRRKDVDEAQSAIVELTKGLADRDEIVLTTGASDDDVLIY
jgi:flagellar motor switch protein FliG